MGEHSLRAALHFLIERRLIMQSRILLIALCAPLLSIQTGAAQETLDPSGTAQETSDDRFYADLGYNRIGSNLLDRAGAAPSIEFGGVNGHVGYRLSKHWSVEGEVMAGVENDKQKYGSIVPNSEGFDVVRSSVTTDLSHLLGVYVKGTIPVTQKLNAFARVGIAHAEFDYESDTYVTDPVTGVITAMTPVTNNTYSETGLGLGIGLTYDITDKIYLRGEYTQYDLIDLEMDSASVGIGLRF